VFNDWVWGAHLLRGNDSSLWRYAKSRSCSGGVTTLDDAVFSNRAMHNDHIDMAEIKAHNIRSQLKTKAQETAQPLLTLYSQVVTDPNQYDVLLSRLSRWPF